MNKSIYERVLDLRNRISLDGNNTIYEEDHLLLDEVLDYIERDTPKNLVLKAGSFFSVNITCPSCGFSINTERPELHSSTMFCERCGQKISLTQRA